MDEPENTESAANQENQNISKTPTLPMTGYNYTTKGGSRAPMRNVSAELKSAATEGGRKSKIRGSRGMTYTY